MTSITKLRVQKHREALRTAGFRPIQIWVPDTRKKGFAKECKRQSMLIQNDFNEKVTLDWLSSVTDDDGWK